jgi:dodecin
MADSVYKVIELVGTSTDSWERAAASAIDQAASSLRDLRIAEVKELDVALDEEGAKTYRAKLSVSFKYEGGG